MKSLIIAAVYGSLVGRDFIHAPKVVSDGNGVSVTESLDEPRANALGYALLIDEPPTCASNQCAVATGYEMRSAASADATVGSALRALRTVGAADVPVAPQPPSRIYRTYRIETVVPPPRRWTPLSIKRSAASLGQWEALKAFLVAANAYDDFCMAQYEQEDDADFARLMEAARQSFGDATVDAILDNAEEEK